MSRSLQPKVRLSADEGKYLRVKLLLANVRLRQIADHFGVSRAFIEQILSGERWRLDIVEYIRAIPESEQMKGMIKHRKSIKAA